MELLVLIAVIIFAVALLILAPLLTTEILSDRGLVGLAINAVVGEYLCGS